LLIEKVEVINTNDSVIKPTFSDSKTDTTPISIQIDVAAYPDSKEIENEREEVLG
jgi:hypothetical protein